MLIISLVVSVAGSTEEEVKRSHMSEKFVLRFPITTYDNGGTTVERHLVAEVRLEHPSRTRESLDSMIGVLPTPVQNATVSPRTVHNNG